MAPSCAAAATPDRHVGEASRRSADQTLAVGWLNVQSLRNKTDTVRLSITERSLDVLAMTETWHVSSDDACLRLATPEGYAVVDAARTSRHGGGVAVVYRKHLRCSIVPVPVSSTFEAVCAKLTTATGSIVILNLYRPGSSKPAALFFEELSAVLETLVVLSCPVVIGGDFNIPMQNTDDPHTRRLGDLLTSFDMVQHVRGATHRCGNTLDLVMTFTDRQLDSVNVDPAGAISDHSLVVCSLPIAVDPPPVAERIVRGWRRVNRDKLRRMLEDSPLCRPVPADADVDQLFATYDAVLRDVADQLAPPHVIRRRPGRPTPWFDAECRAQRRDCRRLERRVRRTNSPSDRRLWVDATRRRFRMYREKKEAYWLGRLMQCGRSSSLLWRSLSHCSAATVTSPELQVTRPNHLRIFS